MKPRDDLLECLFFDSASRSLGIKMYLVDALGK
jgi:hypothetical protein